MREAGSSWFSPEDGRALADFWSVYDDRHAQLAPGALRALQGDADAVATPAPEALLRVERLLRAWCASASEPWHDVDAAVIDCQSFFEPLALGTDAWGQLLGFLQAELTPLVVSAYASEPARLTACLAVLQRYVARTQSTLWRCITSARDGLLARAHQEQERATARFVRLAESGMLGIIICDFNGHIVEANDGFLDKFGYTREELISGCVSWAKMTPPEWRYLDQDAIQQLQSSGRTRPWEKEYFHKNGSRIPILVGVAMLNALQTIAFVLDITERKRLEEVRLRSVELEAQNLRFQEADRMKSEFLANMSHELRTPLHAIMGFAELLHDGDVEANSQHYFEFLRDIIKSGQHLQQIINDVLDLAKVEAGKIELRPEPVDIEQLIAEVCAVLRTEAADKKIQVEAQVAPEARHATLDPARFRQVLYNYLSNALKFTEAGGRVAVRVLPEPAERVRVVVQDTGIGIAPGDHDKLFVAFQQLETGFTRRHGGTGLGLALTKRLVEAQGGSVGLDSVPGQGSQFFAIFPRHTPAPAQRSS